MNLKHLFTFTCCVFSLNGHATLSIFLKDPVSNDYGGGMITSGNLNDRTVESVMPGKKNIGIAGWGGNTYLFDRKVAENTLNLLAEGKDSGEIDNYVLATNGNGYYRFSYMNSQGTILGSLAPNCTPDKTDCHYYIDIERKIVISAGGQEPEVIAKTFKHLQKLQDDRIERRLKGEEVDPFPCYLANNLEISRSYGGETRSLRSSGITLDLEKEAGILRTSSSAEAEEGIVPELKNKMRINFGIDCPL